ncbi:MAG TPA: hypothetical protein PLW65_21025 [Pseudomonadota bacterium]|nr:hypothetical protein [Pseudomonadota bacterium]
MKTEPLTPAALWLRKARSRLGLSRHALALAAGIAPGTLRNAEECRHRISRDCAARLMAEIGRRDALLARTAPSPLREAARPRSQWTDPATQPGTPARPAAPPVAFLRFHTRGARALLQLELDPRAVRKLVGTIADMLTSSERSPLADLPAVHLILMETK